ncbi:hypothetical protein APHAL10511_007879 [Amanita phalloides]|nr:hypothetical protein APHAL10511_007879 [Amanita phalloides]
MAPTTQTVQVAAVVLFYMTAALVMVFVNKAVLNNAPELPLLFLLIQLIIAVMLLHISAFVNKRVELPVVDRAAAGKLVPVVLVNIIGLVFNTLCLRDVDATFFQIARGMVLPLTIFVSALYTKVVPSVRILGAAAVVTIGFLLGVVPHSFGQPTSSPSPSILSLIYGLLSSVFIAVHAVLIKTSLPHCNNSTIQLAWWTNVGSAIFLLPFVLLHGEISLLISKTGDAQWNGYVFIWGCLITGVFGFLLCIAGLLSIKVTSPITHMFSSAAKSVLQTVLGFLIFNDLLNMKRVTSILVIMSGTLYYTWMKHTEGGQKAAKQNNDVEAVPLASKSEEEEESMWQHSEGKIRN